MAVGLKLAGRLVIDDLVGAQYIVAIVDDDFAFEVPGVCRTPLIACFPADGHASGWRGLAFGDGNEFLIRTVGERGIGSAAGAVLSGRGARLRGR